MNWSLAMVIVLVMLAITTLGSTRSAIAASAERLARRVNLELDDAVRPQVERFQRRRMLGTGLGAALGGAAGVLLAPDGDSITVYAIMIGVFGGTAIGAALAALVHLRPAAPRDGASVARLAPVQIDDLVPRSERFGMRYTAVAATAVTLTALAVLTSVDALAPTAQTVTVAAIVLLIIGIMSVVTWELLAGRIARSRPVSGDVQALAWSDALRSLTLRDMVAFPLTACLYGPLALLTATTVGAVDSLARTVTGFALGGIVLVAAVIAIVLAIAALNPSSGRHPAQHYQRQLWPEIAVQPNAAPASASGASR